MMYKIENKAYFFSRVLIKIHSESHACNKDLKNLSTFTSFKMRFASTRARIVFGAMR